MFHSQITYYITYQERCFYKLENLSETTYQRDMWKDWKNFYRTRELSLSVRVLQSSVKKTMERKVQNQRRKSEQTAWEEAMHSSDGSFTHPDTGKEELMNRLHHHKDGENTLTSFHLCIKLFITISLHESYST